MTDTTDTAGMVHHETPIFDARWEGFEPAADATHRYVWIWQGFNLRLIAVPHKGWGWDYGWCYPRDPEALAAAVRAWNPDTQDEPPGWHKRPTWPPRRAPQHDQADPCNRPRCVHGDYIAEGCRTINCPDREGTER